MNSPRPFYPLRKPEFEKPAPADLLWCPQSEPSNLVRFLPRAHPAPAAVAVRPCRASAATSPFPAKSAAPRQSLHTTCLPDLAKPASSGTALEPSSTLLLPCVAPRDARRSQTENPHDRSTLLASHFP